jgi:hypothetical protein
MSRRKLVASSTVLAANDAQGRRMLQSGTAFGERRHETAAAGSTSSGSASTDSGLQAEAQAKVAGHESAEGAVAMAPQKQL